MSLDTHDEASRQRALDSYHVVDSLPEQAYDDIVRLAAVLCDAPIALVSLIDRDRQWFKAEQGIGATESTRDIAICNHAIQAPDTLMEVPDLEADARFADNPFVTGDLGARFYAGMPLVTADGAAIGTVCVLDQQPRQLTDQQRIALEALARLTMHLMDGRSRERALERSAVLQAAAAAAAPDVHAEAADTSGAFTVAILELQDFAGVVQRLGERATERALQQLDDALDRCLQPGRGDVINRSSGSPEFIVVLQGDDVADTLRRVQDALPDDDNLRVLMGAATSVVVSEPMEMVFMRADEALSSEKDARSESLAA